MKKICLLLFLICLSCAKQKTYNDPIEFALAADTDKIQNVMQNLEAHEVQIMVTDSEENTFSFQLNAFDYFYPASSVKFPIALLALERINRISSIDSETLFQIEGDSIKTTIRKEVQKIFAVSDNDAYNRLFEFLRKDTIDVQLQRKAYYLARISHRLSTSNPASTTSKAVTFTKNDSVVFHQERTQNRNIAPLDLKKVHKGKGFYQNDSLISTPMDFSKKNYIPLQTLHDLMFRFHHPENQRLETLFNLSKEDRDFVMKVMSKTPKQQGFTDSEYYDSYVKFFMFGDRKESMPKHIKIYNKVGYAYGYLTDCAHIVDTKNDISFTITATIHVNKNQIFNDDTYEYDEIGIPFLAELGRQVHQFYLNKKQ
ncbi:serine hydrolase [uncultured Kordia sp.]|uniref:serine hydrolase n=1 Tax=uncultured Kordia sp. TaxID=507699 RepID=UPI00260245F8|nr:serine hydrolase [uncultured Kordia sp.]